MLYLVVLHRLALHPKRVKLRYAYGKEEKMRHLLCVCLCVGGREKERDRSTKANHLGTLKRNV